jgi:hypothetical protein
MVLDWKRLILILVQTHAPIPVLPVSVGSPVPPTQRKERLLHFFVDPLDSIICFLTQPYAVATNPQTFFTLRNFTNTACWDGVKNVLRILKTFYATLRMISS